MFGFATGERAALNRSGYEDSLGHLRALTIPAVWGGRRRKAISIRVCRFHANLAKKRKPESEKNGEKQGVEKKKDRGSVMSHAVWCG